MQPGRIQRRLNCIAAALAAVYALDRLLKLLAVHRFLRRPAPPAPDVWPSVSLLQPITRGASDLRGVLACRAALRYAGRLQHILICDAQDAGTLAQCRTWQAAHGDLDIRIVTAGGEQPGASAHRAGGIASKVEKLRVGLPLAEGEVLTFVDDDILLRPEAVEGAVRYLLQPRAGSVFGLAVYTNWRNAASSLLSAFVNANALLSYLPLTYLAEPWTITGHFYALRRGVFDAIGGLEEMAGRFDDDHELARRVHQHGLANVQTPLLYDVDNDLATIDDYANQMHRWFVIPRQTMAPYLTPQQQAASLLASAGHLIPPLLALLALLRRSSPRPFLAALGTFAAVYTICEQRYLGPTTPLQRWPLVLISALIAPLQALAGLLGPNTFRWRGRRIQLEKGGRFEVIE